MILGLCTALQEPALTTEAVFMGKRRIQGKCLNPNKTQQIFELKQRLKDKDDEAAKWKRRCKLKDLTVPELRDKCKQNDLPAPGSKNDLIERLVCFYHPAAPVTLQSEERDAAGEDTTMM